jgi:hypothetical protein
MKQYEIVLGQLEAALDDAKINIVRMQDETLSPYDRVMSQDIGVRNFFQISKLAKRLATMMSMGQQAMDEGIYVSGDGE